MKLRRLLNHLPTGMLSGIVLAAILWLTLAPHPTGDVEIPLFPGADKIVHALMFFGLTAAFLVDIMRFRRWHEISLLVIGGSALASALIGIAVELAQNAMGLGRSMELMDIIADCAGAFIAAAIWALTQQRWAAK